MGNDRLSLNYNVPKVIRLVGKNAANTAERPISNIVWAVVLHPAYIQITPDPSDAQKFIVKSINATANVSDQINFSATNELGNTITGNVPITFIPSDPAITLEASYSDPS
jgi:hypothetical protein